MKKVIFAIMLVGVLLLTSCAKITVQNEEDRTELNKFNYILIKEGDEWCLHTISAYLAHEEGVGVTTKCCQNNIWAPYCSIILYKYKPEHIPSKVHRCAE